MIKQQPLYVLHGRVVHGRGRGHKVHMPTANLQADPGQPLPPDGVYATISCIDGRARLGVTNVGRRPTVDSDPDITVETFYPDYAADLYEKRMSVCFYHLLRDIRRFDSLEQVKLQVQQDVARARALLHPLLEQQQRGDGQ